MELHGVRYEYDFTSMFKEKSSDAIGKSPVNATIKEDFMEDRDLSSEVGHALTQGLFKTTKDLMKSFKMRQKGKVASRKNDKKLLEEELKKKKS